MGVFVIVPLLPADLGDGVYGLAGGVATIRETLQHGFVAVGTARAAWAWSYAGVPGSR